MFPMKFDITVVSTGLSVDDRCSVSVSCNAVTCAKMCSKFLLSYKIVVSNTCSNFAFDYASNILASTFLFQISPSTICPKICFNACAQTCPFPELFKSVVFQGICSTCVRHFQKYLPTISQCFVF